MMIENFSQFDLNMRVQLHLDYLVEHGDHHEDFEKDVLKFCEGEITSIEHARLHVSIAKLAGLINVTPEDYEGVQQLIGICLLKAETYLLFCDQKAGRA